MSWLQGRGQIKEVHAYTSGASGARGIAAKLDPKELNAIADHGVRETTGHECWLSRKVPR